MSDEYSLRLLPDQFSLQGPHKKITSLFWKDINEIIIKTEPADGIPDCRLLLNYSDGQLAIPLEAEGFDELFDFLSDFYTFDHQLFTRAISADRRDPWSAVLWKKTGFTDKPAQYRYKAQQEKPEPKKNLNDLYSEEGNQWEYSIKLSEDEVIVELAGSDPQSVRWQDIKQISIIKPSAEGPEFFLILESQSGKICRVPHRVKGYQNVLSKALELPGFLLEALTGTMNMAIDVPLSLWNRPHSSSPPPDEEEPGPRK